MDFPAARVFKAIPNGFPEIGTLWDEMLLYILSESSSSILVFGDPIVGDG